MRDGRGPTRTGDPLGVNEVLWPAELRAPAGQGTLRLAGSSGFPVGALTEAIRSGCDTGQACEAVGMRPGKVRAIRPIGRRPAVAVIVVGLAGAVVVVLVLAVLAQLVLPALAASRVRERVGRYGTVLSVSVSAFPAIKLLWKNADSVTVKAQGLRVTPAQTASLLSEARGMHDLDLSAASLREGPLTLHDATLRKRGDALFGEASLAQSDVRAALPAGVAIQLLGSAGGEVLVRVSGGLFGVGASVNAVVNAQDGKLIAQPRGLPFAGLARITLFSNPRVYVQGVGATVKPGQPGDYRLTMTATLR
jgi:hypothetical protein